MARLRHSATAPAGVIVVSKLRHMLQAAGEVFSFSALISKAPQRSAQHSRICASLSGRP